MKKIAIVTLLLTTGLTIAAQERTLTEAEFTEIHSIVQAKLYRGEHGPYRLVLETNASTKGRPDLTYNLKSVTLTVPGLGTHRVDNRLMGQSSQKTESIVVDGQIYLRANDGSWTATSVKSRPPEAEPKTPSLSSQELGRHVEVKYNGIQDFGGRRVHVYTKTEYKKSLHQQGDSMSEIKSATTVYISEDNKYYRFMTNSDILRTDGTVSSNQILIEVEADPTIEIKAPETGK